MSDDELNLSEYVTIAKDYGHTEEQVLIEVNSRLAAGAEVNEPDRGGTTAVMAAAAKGYISVVKVLISAGADLTLKNKWKDDVITCAKLSKNQELIKFLRTVDKSEPVQDEPSFSYYQVHKGCEAEYTFRPSKKFKSLHNSDHEDVGYFLNEHEILSLIPISPTKQKNKLTIICIDEGEITLNSSDWEKLDKKTVNALLKKKGFSIYSVENVVSEYLNEV